MACVQSFDPSIDLNLSTQPRNLVEGFAKGTASFWGGVVGAIGLPIQKMLTEKPSMSGVVDGAARSFIIACMGFYGALYHPIAACNAPAAIKNLPPQHAEGCARLLDLNPCTQPRNLCEGVAKGAAWLAGGTVSAVGVPIYKMFTEQASLTGFATGAAYSVGEALEGVFGAVYHPVAALTCPAGRANVPILSCLKDRKPTVCGVCGISFEMSALYQGNAPRCRTCRDERTPPDHSHRHPVDVIVFPVHRSTERIDHDDFSEDMDERSDHTDAESDGNHYDEHHEDMDERYDHADAESDGNHYHEHHEDMDERYDHTDAESDGSHYDEHHEDMDERSDHTDAESDGNHRDEHHDYMTDMDLRDGDSDDSEGYLIWLSRVATTVT